MCTLRLLLLAYLLKVIPSLATMTTLSAKSVPRSLMSSLVAVEPDPRTTHSAAQITGVLDLRLERTVAPCTPLNSAAASRLSAYGPNPSLHIWRHRSRSQATAYQSEWEMSHFLRMALRLSLNLLHCPPRRRALSAISPYIT